MAVRKIPSFLASTPPGAGQALVYVGGDWVPTDVATQAELDAETAARIAADAAHVAAADPHTGYRLESALIAVGDLAFDPATQVELDTHTALTTTAHGGIVASTDARIVTGQIWLPSAGMWPSSTSGCKTNSLVEYATNKQNIYTLDFIDGSTTYCEGSVVMPFDWNGGTIAAKFVWLAVDATTNAVVWSLQGRCCGDGDAIDGSWGAAVNVTDANASTSNQIRISAVSAAITIGGSPGASKLVQFRASRVGADSSDTLTVDARLVGVIVNYTRS